MDSTQELDKLKHATKIMNLGKAGESIIANYFASMENTRVELSVDSYDSKKDMTVYQKIQLIKSVDDFIDDGESITIIVNEKTVEVKTQTPYFTTSELTIRKSQLDKCRMVDELYFVAVPDPKWKSDLAGCIYKVDPEKFRGRPYKKQDKFGGVRYMIGIGIHQEAVTKVKDLTQQEIEYLLKAKS
jgi:hypothetical protein